MTSLVLAADGAWHAAQLGSGKWAVVREYLKGGHLHKQVLSEGGSFVRYESEQMASLMAGKMNR